MGRKWRQVLDYVTNCQTFSNTKGISNTHTALDGTAANQMPIAIQLTIQVEGRTGSKTRQDKGEATRRMRYL